MAHESARARAAQVVPSAAALVAVLAHALLRLSAGWRMRGVVGVHVLVVFSVAVVVEEGLLHALPLPCRRCGAERVLRMRVG